MAVMTAADSSVIRTAPIFTNIKNLWKSHLQLHKVGARILERMLQQWRVEMQRLCGELGRGYGRPLLLKCA